MDSPINFLNLLLLMIGYSAITAILYKLFHIATELGEIKELLKNGALRVALAETTPDGTVVEGLGYDSDSYAEQVLRQVKAQEIEKGRAPVSTFAFATNPVATERAAATGPRVESSLDSVSEKTVESNWATTGQNEVTPTDLPSDLWAAVDGRASMDNVAAQVNPQAAGQTVTRMMPRTLETIVPTQSASFPTPIQIPPANMLPSSELVPNHLARFQGGALEIHETPKFDSRPTWNLPAATSFAEPPAIEITESTEQSFEYLQKERETAHRESLDVKFDAQISARLVEPFTAPDPHESLSALSLASARTHLGTPRVAPASSTARDRYPSGPLDLPSLSSANDQTGDWGETSSR